MGGAAPPEKHQRGCPADRCVAWCTHPCPIPTTALHCRRALHEPPCDALGPPPYTFRQKKAVRCDGRCSALRWHMQCGAMANAARCDGSCSALHRPMQRTAFSVPLPGRRLCMRLRLLFCPSPKRNAARWSPPRSIPYLLPYACLQDAEVVCMARIRLYSWK